VLSRLEVAQYVEMQGARLDALHPAGANAKAHCGSAVPCELTGSSCVKRPLCPSVRPFFIVLSSAS
jgi:hypothetical protein